MGHFRGKWGWNWYDCSMVGFDSSHLGEVWLIPTYWGLIPLPPHQTPTFHSIHISHPSNHPTKHPATKKGHEAKWIQAIHSFQTIMHTWDNQSPLSECSIIKIDTNVQPQINLVAVLFAWDIYSLKYCRHKVHAYGALFKGIYTKYHQQFLSHESWKI